MGADAIREDAAGAAGYRRDGPQAVCIPFSLHSRTSTGKMFAASVPEHRTFCSCVFVCSRKNWNCRPPVDRPVGTLLLPRRPLGWLSMGVCGFLVSF